MRAPGARWLGRLLRDRSGGVAMITALATVPLLCLSGLVLDAGNLYRVERSLQNATDLAAIAAANNLTNATAAAAANVAQNGFAASDIAKIEYGVYAPNSSVAPALRFVVGPVSSANAVRVTMTHSQSLFLSNFEGIGSVPITTRGMAVYNQAASFNVTESPTGSTAALLSSLLGAIFGLPTLSVADWSPLSGTQVDLFALTKALSVLEGQPNATYGQAMSTTIPFGQFITALEQMAPGQSSLLSQFVTPANAGKSINLAALCEFGPYAILPAAGTEPTTTATASLLFLVQAAGDLAANSTLLAPSLSISVPLLGPLVTTKLVMGLPPGGRTMIAVDDVGTMVNTPKMLITMLIGFTTPVAGYGNFGLPLFLELGYGSAVLSKLACTPLDQTQTAATLAVTPGVMTMGIGTISDSDLTSMSPTPNVQPATIFSLPLLATSVTWKSALQYSTPTTSNVVFAATDISNAVTKGTPISGVLVAELTSAISQIQYTVNVGPVSVSAPTALTSGVASVLGAAAAPIGALVDQVVQALGLGIGNAYTSVTGANCRPANLAS